MHFIILLMYIASVVSAVYLYVTHERERNRKAEEEIRKLLGEKENEL